MPHSQAFRYFLHRHQELIAEPIGPKNKARGSAAGFCWDTNPALQFFERAYAHATNFQDLVSKTLTAGSITPDNGGRPQGH
jgi:hypothetical protein